MMYSQRKAIRLIPHPQRCFLPEFRAIVPIAFEDAVVAVVVATVFAPLEVDGSLVNRVGSFLAAADVSDCKTEFGRSIPSREASVANWSTSCLARFSGTCTLAPGLLLALVWWFVVSTSFGRCCCCVTIPLIVEDTTLGDDAPIGGVG